MACWDTEEFIISSNLGLMELHLPYLSMLKLKLGLFSVEFTEAFSQTGGVQPDSGIQISKWASEMTSKTVITDRLLSPSFAILVVLSGCLFSKLCWRMVMFTWLWRFGDLILEQKQTLRGFEQLGQVGLLDLGSEFVFMAEVLGKISR